MARPGIGILGLALWTAVLAAAPRRVVSLAPSITEMLVDLGAADRIVGVTRYDHDPAVARVPRVGGWTDPSLEALARLKPDLVLLTRAQVPFVGPDLEKLGLRYRALPAQTLEDILAGVDSLGRWLGLASAAARLKAALQETLVTYRKRSVGVPPVPVVFLADRTPGTLQNLYAVGTGTFLHELLNLTGFRNLVRRPGYVPLNLEYLLQLRPALILEMVQGPATQPDAAWQTVGLQDRVVHLDADLFSHPSTRFPAMLRRLWQLRRRFPPMGRAQTLKETEGQAGSGPGQSHPDR